MLTTLLRPSGGKAKVADHDLFERPERVRTRIGYVGQNGGADPNATGRKNLMLQARLHGSTRRAAAERVEELVSALDLASFVDRKARTCSGGQRRRLDLALGMVHRPAILFLDEPTAGLDPQSRSRLWDEVRKLRDVGATVFLTTHYLEEADALCDRLAIIDYGRIVAQGSPESLKHRVSGDALDLAFHDGNQQDSLRRAHDLLASQPFVREIVAEGLHLRLYVDQAEKTLPLAMRLLDGADVLVSSASVRRPTLDDVFLKQTGRSLREDHDGQLGAA
jgi:ABC-2 type transport system ATP-binding protein